MVGKAKDTKTTATAKEALPAIGTMGTVEFPPTRAESGTAETIIATQDIVDRGNAKQAKVTDTDITHPFGTCVPFGACVCEAE